MRSRRREVRLDVRDRQRGLTRRARRHRAPARHGFRRRTGRPFCMGRAAPAWRAFRRRTGRPSCNGPPLLERVVVQELSRARARLTALGRDSRESTPSTAPAAKKMLLTYRSPWARRRWRRALIALAPGARGALEHEAPPTSAEAIAEDAVGRDRRTRRPSCIGRAAPRRGMPFGVARAARLASAALLRRRGVPSGVVRAARLAMDRRCSNASSCRSSPGRERGLLRSAAGIPAGAMHRADGEMRVVCPSHAYAGLQ